MMIARIFMKQPNCGRGYKINLEQINNKLEIINIDNI